MATPSQQSDHPRDRMHGKLLAWLAALAAIAVTAPWPVLAVAQTGAVAPVLATDDRASVLPHTITLEMAMRQAFAANPGLQAAQYGVAASEGAILQSQARPNPELAYSQEDTRSKERSITLQVNQLIEIGGKREARIREAETEKALASANIFETEAALRFQVVTAFYELLLAQEREENALKTHALAQQALDAAQKRVRAGTSVPLEASRAQVAEANVLLEVQQAQSLIVVAQQSLASLWGGRAGALGRATGDFSSIPEPPTADQIEHLIDQAPDMLLARRALEQSQAVSSVERSKRLQDPTLSLGVKRANDLGRNQLVVGVSIPLPLFDSNAGNQLQALRKVDQAQQMLQNQRLQLQAEVLVARQQLLSSNQQVALLESQVVPTAESAYNLAVRGFTLGRFNFLEVLDAQRSLFEGQRQLLEQRMASHRARAEIDRLLGTSSLIPTATVAPTATIPSGI
ncbi:TolC family protein [Lampropedia aestuarii]|nr:TolC family protein [Lampropedia aestuarii]MDH5856814.1 TolC family protein [Lampropedia aestuarii]